MKKFHLGGISIKIWTKLLLMTVMLLIQDNFQQKISCQEWAWWISISWEISTLIIEFVHANFFNQLNLFFSIIIYHVGFIRQSKYSISGRRAGHKPDWPNSLSQWILRQFISLEIFSPCLFRLTYFKHTLITWKITINFCENFEPRLDLVNFISIKSIGLIPCRSLYYRICYY